MLIHGDGSLIKKDFWSQNNRPRHQVQSSSIRGLKCNALQKTPTAPCTHNTLGEPSAARRYNFKKWWPCRTMSVMGDHPKKQHVHKKQVNRHNTYTTTMCKQRAVFVCPTSEQWGAEQRTCAQLLFPCSQWASPGSARPKGPYWEACTHSDIWTTQEGGIIPIPCIYSLFF